MIQQQLSNGVKSGQPFPEVNKPIKDMLQQHINAPFGNFYVFEFIYMMYGF